MAKKVTLENLADKIDKGFKYIHEDLIKHDERTEKIIEMIQGVEV